MKNLNQENQFNKLLELLEKYREKRPEPERNLDQFWADEKIVFKRALILGKTKDISQKSLLFLGDDDMTSLAFSLFFQAQKITVVDIDQRLLSFLEHIAQQEKMPIEFILHDLKNPLPKDEFRNYDVVFFDPPYTPYAVNTWLIRAMEATLGKGSNKARKRPEVLSRKQYLMCYGYTDRGTERGLKIQKIITSLGLIIQEKIKNFNKYYGAESIGSQSDLYILQPTPKVNIRQLNIARSQFYTGQKK